MKETERIITLFENLYEGNPWIDVTIAATLKNITAKKAAKKILPKHNSIWEIVNHIISWRLNVLQRVQGKTINTPKNNYFNQVKDKSESAWQNTLSQLKESQLQWINFLKTFKEASFEKIYQNNSMTYYEHIQGIIQHDAYHLGQIILLTKIIY